MSPGRFSGLLCFSFQLQLVPGFIISKGNKAPDGRKLAGAQGAGPSALGASQQIVLGNRAAIPAEGAGWEEPHSPQYWTLEEPLCEQDCSPGWWDCLGR